MSINQKDAWDLVLKHINECSDETRIYDKEKELMIRDSTPYGDDGWIFSYDTKKSIEEDNWRYSLAGNHSLFVFKDNGKIYSIYTDTTLEEIIKKHRKISSNQDHSTHPSSDRKAA